MVLTDITPCSIAEENNNITIYNRATICEWQSAIIAHVTFIVSLPAGLECWHALTGKSLTGGALLSVTLTSCWEGLWVHPGGWVEVGDRRRERVGVRKSSQNEWNIRPYPSSPSPYEYVNQTGQVGINDSPPRGIQGERSRGEKGALPSGAFIP